MGKFRVGFIGTGKRRERPGPMGYAMAYQHAEAYRKLPDCELVACADIVEENARAFAETFGITRIYTDYRVCSEIEPNEPSGRANLPVSLIHPNCLSAELPKFSARQEPRPPFPNTLHRRLSMFENGVIIG
jgi:hypothetical protein